MTYRLAWLSSLESWSFSLEAHLRPQVNHLQFLFSSPFSKPSSVSFESFFFLLSFLFSFLLFPLFDDFFFYLLIYIRLPFSTLAISPLILRHQSYLPCLQHHPFWEWMSFQGFLLLTLPILGIFRNQFENCLVTKWIENILLLFGGKKNHLFFAFF